MHQPYHQGLSRPPTFALLAMLAGRGLYQPNPMDQHRLLARYARTGFRRYL